MSILHLHESVINLGLNFYFIDKLNSRIFHNLIKGLYAVLNENF